MAGDKKILNISATAADEDTKNEVERENWKSPFQFIFYCLGYAVGFGNVWRFPYLCYKNGGAAFLIPYLSMLFLAGIPVFFMELTIGQYISQGPAVLFPKLAPIFSGLGWGVVTIAFFTAIYFNVILAWSFFYMIFSFYSVVPWSHCDNEFNSPACYYEEGAALCRNQSLFFFNQSCLSLEDYCSLADLIPFNETHCQNFVNTSLTSTEKVTTKISASEDFFRYMGSGNNCSYPIRAISFLRLLDFLVTRLPSYYERRLIDLANGRVNVTVSRDFSWRIINPQRMCVQDGLPLPITGMTTDVNPEGMANGGDVEPMPSTSSGTAEMLQQNEVNRELRRKAKCVVSMKGNITTVTNPDDSADVKSFTYDYSYWSFDGCKEEPNGYFAKQSPNSKEKEFEVRFSMLEIYNEVVHDLLNPTKSKKGLKVRQHPKKGFYACLDLVLLGFFHGLGSIPGDDPATHAHCSLHHEESSGFRNVFKAIEEMKMTLRLPLRIYWGVTWLCITPVSLILITVISFTDIVPASWESYVFPDAIQILGWLTCCCPLVCVVVGAVYAMITNKGGFLTLLKTTPEFCPASQRGKQEKEMNAKFRYFPHNEAFTMETKTP
ncbi:sodium- and chloride-dependent glycine transporter 2-like [Portunus trituberculatus]|uniref:sodium- and chloride-dependent glycine transporter 2-like n=1 Tax=Portunus trituberculatus TaxID=210409 RepID=UPI001E1CF0F8|nr:sodium- and chloride-dependent glycine transporter 2-like [Portunus trituberculatus]